VTEGRVVAVVAGSDGLAFDRQLVVLDTEACLMQVSRWAGGEPLGQELTDDEYAERFEAGELVALSRPVPPRGSTFAWVLGAGVARLADELVGWLGPALLTDEVHHGRRFLVVDEVEAGDARTDWAEVARAAAEQALRERRGEDALRWAELSWRVGPTVAPEQVATLVRASEAAGRPEVGAEVRAIERQTRGERFDREVQQLLALGGRPEGEARSAPTAG
jgi:hypothetical protein